MELIEIKKVNKKINVYIRHDEIEIPSRTALHPVIHSVNEEIFDTGKKAIDYYQAVKDSNIMAIADNEKRLVQMPKDALEKIAVFADQIADLMFDDEGEVKEKLQHNKKLKEINDLILAYNNLRSFEKNITKLQGFNKEIDKILKELKKVK